MKQTSPDKRQWWQLILEEIAAEHSAMASGDVRERVAAADEHAMRRILQLENLTLEAIRDMLERLDKQLSEEARKIEDRKERCRRLSRLVEGAIEARA